jgi:tetratricopeptide (TPR) repeat protein
VAASFGDHFSGTRRRRLVEPVERAREFIKGGRTELALLAFREALELQPTNWITIREAARFVAYSIQDHRAGQALAESGLALNPLSADLWNTRGDCLFQQNLHAKAHESFLKALEVHPNDIRARYNLVYTYAQQRDLEAALRMTAEGLAKDQTGDYRERFLQRQSEILSRLEQLRRRRTHFFANRSTPISISLGFDD